MPNPKSKISTSSLLARLPSSNGPRKCVLSEFHATASNLMFSPTFIVGSTELWSILKIIPGRILCGRAPSRTLIPFTGMLKRPRKAAWSLIFTSLWDSFRSQIPFLTIFDPSSVAQMIRSLIDTQRHLGWLPDCRMSLCKGKTLSN